MVYCALIALMAWSAPENFLKNPGFEQITPGSRSTTAGAVDRSTSADENLRPTDWDLFLQPQNGAKASIDGLVAFDGDHSVMIHNARPYLKDPCNNWSQNITTNLAGKKLLLRGHIKTDKATEAAIWLQCWRRNPWGITSLAMTSDNKLITGTVDWTPVQIEVETPADTDFITVRCVLKGEGTAWFDDLAVEDLTPEKTDPSTPDPPKNETNTTPPAETPAPQAPSSSATQPAAPPETAPVDKTEPAPEEQRQVEEVKKAIADAMDSLRATNDAQAAEIAKLRDEIAILRGQLEKLTAPPKPVSPPVRSVPRVPPLVPHGYVVEE